MRLARRSLLAWPALALTGVALSGCGEDLGDVRTADRPGEGRRDYGEDPSQYGVLYRPPGDRADRPRGVVVVIHGGFWKAAYDLSYGAPLATALAADGWLAWNLEYRRVGNGGGVPETLDDVAAGIDLLADLDLGIAWDDVPVVGLGHSAGGHLAVWAAGRPDARVPMTHVLSQAGVLDLRTADADGLGGGAVAAFLGHHPTSADDRYDPVRQVPLAIPAWCVHGTDDGIVPIGQSEAYVDAATAAGATAELVRVDGDHFALIDTDSSAWQRQREILDSLG